MPRSRPLHRHNHTQLHADLSTSSLSILLHDMMDKNHTDDQINTSRLFSSNDKLLAKLTMVPSSLCCCVQSSSSIKNMSTGTLCQPADLLYSLYGLAAPPRTPPQQRHHFVFIRSRKCHRMQFASKYY